MMCSNGNSYLMYCAPGTRNQGGRTYSKSYTDFCDVNLNDYGYGASKYGSQKAFSSSHGHGSSGYQMPHKQPSYKPAPSYHMPHKAPSYTPHKKPSYGQPLKPRQHYPIAYVPVYMGKY